MLEAAMVKKMKVAEIKVELAKRGLPENGLKGEVMARLLAAIASSETQQAEADDAGPTPVQADEPGVPETGAAASADGEVEPEAAVENGAVGAALEEEPSAAEAGGAVQEETTGAVATLEAPVVGKRATDTPEVEDTAEPAAKRSKVDSGEVPEPEATATVQQVSAAPAPAQTHRPTQAVPATNGLAPAVSAQPAQRQFRVGTDPRGREVFLENLAPEVTEEELIELCKQVGPLASVKMSHSADGQFRGIALATFVDRVVARNAKTALAGKELHGKTITTRDSGTENTVFLARVRREWTEEFVFSQLLPLTQGLLRVDMTAEPSDPSRSTNRGFGFAVFDSREAAKTFVDAHGGEGTLIIAGNPLGVRWSMPPAHQIQDGGPEQPEERTGVYIANVAADLTEVELREAFGPYGTITKAVLGSSMTHASRSDFAIINYMTGAEAAGAIAAMNGKMLKDKTVEVTLARPTDKSKRRGPMMQGPMSVPGYSYGGRNSMGGFGGPRGAMGGRGFGGRGGPPFQQFPQPGGWPRPPGGPPAAGYRPPFPPAPMGYNIAQQGYGYPPASQPGYHAYPQQTAAYGQMVQPPAAQAPAQQQYPGYYDAQGNYHWN